MKWTIAERSAVGVQLAWGFPREVGGIEAEELIRMLRKKANDPKVQELVRHCEEAAKLYIKIIEEDQPGCMEITRREIKNYYGDEYPE